MLNAIMEFTHEVFTGGCDIALGWLNFPFSSQDLIILKLRNYRYRILSYFQNSKEP